MGKRDFELDVSEFLQAVGLLIRRARAAAASHEVSLTETGVLARLAKGGPMTTADLARAEGVRPQSMGTTVAALEEMGLVEKKPHATDGRQMDLVLTAKGSTIRKSVRAAKQGWLVEAIGELEEKDQARLFRAGEIIKRMVERG